MGPFTPRVVDIRDRDRKVGVTHSFHYLENLHYFSHRGADKSLARPGRKQATATEDFEFHISYL